ncbi:MAG: hypothetical protein AAF928_09420 [Myxococcota bacterium]
MKLRAICLVGLGVLAVGCEHGDDGSDAAAVGQVQDQIVEVAHTAVERQSIGNCWLYSQATWVESLNLTYLQAHPQGDGGEPTDVCVHSVCEEGDRMAADCNSCATKICDADPYCCNTGWDSLCTGAVASLCGADACDTSPEPPPPAEPVEPLDVSQSYWTYWHWFDQVTDNFYGDEIQTGGWQWKSNAIVRDRGVMNELDFVPEDSDDERSQRQADALAAINTALKSGELSTQDARRDGETVRRVFDEAWGLSEEVRAHIDTAFGADGETTLRTGGTVAGTPILDPATIPVQYTVREDGQSVVKVTNLVEAIGDWSVARYPGYGSASQRRSFQQRVQRALHDQNPVVITWDVDFNAMVDGAFNLDNLAAAGAPGRQGGHMTVLADYQATTDDFGLFEAGVTLDESDPQYGDKVDALMSSTTEIDYLRTKNSWGTRDGEPLGYHQLHMDYLDGPIKFCPGTDNPTNETCTGESNPWRDAMLPPGY